eukprot:GHVR01192368.1.p1 GENE.GHVR01192368.1~~GHVR01192368.1.p1  ORF type:complete len:396 (-),score=105.21 GHVR01192368.1:691-1878(-)
MTKSEVTRWPETSKDRFSHDKRLQYASRGQPFEKKQSDDVLKTFFERLKEYKNASTSHWKVGAGTPDAQDTIQSFQSIHTKKVKALMNSIDKLKKENSQYRTDAKEHNRSESFKLMQTELGLQDSIIDSFYNVIGKERSNIIIKEAQTRGPPRVEFKSRLDLRNEIKDLRDHIVRVERKKTNAEERESKLFESFEQSTKQHASDFKEVQTALETLRDELKETKQKLMSAEAERAASQALVDSFVVASVEETETKTDIDSLKGIIETITEERDIYKNELDTLRVLLIDIKAANAASQVQIQTSESTHTAMSKEILSLREKLETERKTLLELQSKQLIEEQRRMETETDTGIAMQNEKLKHQKEVDALTGRYKQDCVCVTHTNIETHTHVFAFLTAS